MTYVRLLAKSTEKDKEDAPLHAQTLPGHLEHVGKVAEELAGARGLIVLEALRLDSATWAEPLRRATLLGALLHDIGKANDHFQDMVRRRRRDQALRHEVVGLWMLATSKPLQDWLFAAESDVVRYAAIRAIVGHHVKFVPATSLAPKSVGKETMGVSAGHADVAEALAAVGERLDLGPPPHLRNTTIDLIETEVPEVDRLLRAAQRWWDSSDDETPRFAAAVAALVVAADVCGSALVRHGRDPVGWVREALGLVPTAGDFLSTATGRLKGDSPRPFQEAVASSSTRLTLATAGCGSGKTVAAYLWAAAHLGERKLFFCYPTTGTATEGFRDYAFQGFEADAALVHSRAELDLERMLDNGADDAEPDLSSDGHAAVEASAASPDIRAVQKEQGLRLWEAKMTVCTADAVLGLVQNNRVGLFGSSAFLGAGFVFDEIHLYDDRMFGTLLAFLESFRGAPILMMTATLQPARRAKLRELAVRLGEGIEEIGGPPELEELPRYAIERATHDAALARAIAEAKDGARVLWVANTVGRAIRVARAAEEAGVRIEPYHSRYRYADRQVRHGAVMDGLGQRRLGTGGMMAVTTQVCEVSLDISADLLVTELASPSALIQRLGRLNRWAKPGDGSPPLPALVVEPPRPEPYRDDELARGQAWLARVTGRATSQRDLADAFAAVLAGSPEPEPTLSAWLDRGWELRPDPVREGGMTFPFVRAEDRPACLDERGRPIAARVTENTIPMLWFGKMAEESRGWPRLGGALVAPADRITYDERWGAQWR